MISQENLNEWFEHPVTQLYLSRLEQKAAQENSMEFVDVTTLSLEEIGAVGLAKANYASALRDATDIQAVLGEVSDERDD